MLVVTGDAGLLALVEFQGIPVMSAVKFLEWWADKEPPAAE